MRVLHVLHTSLPYICGYSIRTDRILAHQRRLGVEVEAITSAQQPDGTNTPLAGDIPAFRTSRPALKRSPLRELQLMHALRRRLEEVVDRARPDIIHAHSPVLVGLPARSVARRRDIPFVYEVRDLWENASVDRGKFGHGSVPYRAARALETFLLRRSDAVVTICESLQQELSTRCSPRFGITIARNGVDTTAFRPGQVDGQVRQRLGVGDGPLIAYIGSFQPYEGLEILIDALAALNARRPDVRAVIVGDGPERSLLEQRAERLGLTAIVRFTGRVPHESVADWYAAADLLPYPRISTRTTALTTPLKPLEAMAMERCVVASDLPAMREIVRDNVTGVLFAAGRPDLLAGTLEALLQDTDRRRSLAAAARAWVERECDWTRIVPCYVSLYENLVRSARHEDSRVAVGGAA